jgi:hypothetical protein
VGFLWALADLPERGTARSQQKPCAGRWLSWQARPLNIPKKSRNGSPRPIALHLKKGGKGYGNKEVLLGIPPIGKKEVMRP